MIDAGLVQQELLDLFDDLGRPLRRRGARELDCRDDVALVLGRQEPGRRRLVQEDDDRRWRRRARRRRRAGVRRDLVHGLDVLVARRVERPVEPAEESASAARVLASVSSTEHSAGVSESATIPDSTTAITIVTANCLYSAPVMPPMKATGMKTEQRTMTMAISALPQLADRAIGGDARRDVLVFHGALDVLDDDDRVVDDDTDREDQSKEREQVDGEAEQRHPEERADDGDRHGQGGDERRAPLLQEDVHDDRDQDDRDEQRDLDLVDRRRDEWRQVEPDRPSARRAGSASRARSIRATTPSLACSALAPARRKTMSPAVGLPLRRITLS